MLTHVLVRKTVTSVRTNGTHSQDNGTKVVHDMHMQHVHVQPNEHASVLASVPTRRPAPPYAPVARTASSSEWSALSYVEKISDREHQIHARLKESVETKR